MPRQKKVFWRSARRPSGHVIWSSRSSHSADANRLHVCRWRLARSWRNPFD